MNRFKLPVAVHTFLLCSGSVLLLRRRNTGFADGKYGLVGGHVEGSEPITRAVIRECRVEVISEEDFPHLFQDTTWEVLKCRFELCRIPPPAGLIGNVNLVPFVGDRWVMIRLQDGTWDIPGGTLEPGESYLQAIRRELEEEAGARLVTFEPLGAWLCRSTSSEPYRPHLPHPEFYRFVGYGEVEIVGVPQNPAGAEQVKCVACASIEQTSKRFLSQGRPELAELYRLVAAARRARRS